jgi:hypothetical protein
VLPARNVVQSSRGRRIGPAFEPEVDGSLDPPNAPGGAGFAEGAVQLHGGGLGVLEVGPQENVPESEVHDVDQERGVLIAPCEQAPRGALLTMPPVEGPPEVPFHLPKKAAVHR